MSKQECWEQHGVSSNSNQKHPADGEVILDGLFKKASMEELQFTCSTYRGRDSKPISMMKLLAMAGWYNSVSRLKFSKALLILYMIPPRFFLSLLTAYKHPSDS
ncbi:hypothetical protein Drorol1_Dr00025104 [Drosera rotundifolia]